jgi:hypothetical protein
MCTISMSLPIKIKELLAGVKEPKSSIMTVNAGAIPPNHWTQDKAVGNGRIVGERCSFREGSVI